MAIRAYRQPTPRKSFPVSQPVDPRDIKEDGYVDVYVIMEKPLLELLQRDLVFLKNCGIDPFTVVD